VQAINDHASPSRRDSLFVVSAELNTKDWSDVWHDHNDLGHALVTFELYGQILENEKTRQGAMWTTRWMNDDVADQMWYGLGPENEILPAGRTVAVWGQFLGNRMVDISRTDKLVTFASPDSETGRLSLFVTNKDTEAHELFIDVSDSMTYASAGVFEFSGSGSEDMNPQWAQKDSILVSENSIQGYQAPATSLTVFSLVPDQPPLGTKAKAGMLEEIRIASVKKSGKGISVEMMPGSSLPEYGRMSIYTLDGRLLQKSSIILIRTTGECARYVSEYSDKSSSLRQGMYIMRMELAGVALRRKVMF
jgi:hypothetical protein